jgi:hypothetical protein
MMRGTAVLQGKVRSRGVRWAALLIALPLVGA